MAELTPMMKQYLEIKERNKDAILFFRLGDFYEMFNEDAYLASRELDLTLTTRDKTTEDPDERTPMCGVPYHSSEAYIARLLAKGYKVAVCEQMEDPSTAKGLVSREVVRVITPGTVIDGSMLEEGRSNYICSVYADSCAASACFADISTGEICGVCFTENAVSHIKNELGRFAPSEAVLNAAAGENSDIRAFSEEKLGGCLMQQADDRFDYMPAVIRVCGQFGLKSVDELGDGATPALICAVGGLLSYLYDTQKTDLSHINKLNIYTTGQYMELDLMTRRNLELTETLRSKENRGSLLWVLDRTSTPMGRRLIRSWVERPLLSPAPIKRRQNAIAELFNETVLRGELIGVLKGISDVERLIGRVVYGNANARDLVAIADSASNLPGVADILRHVTSAMLKELSAIDTLEDLGGIIQDAIEDSPPVLLREGGLIRPGYNEEVDRLRDVMKNGKNMFAEIEARERERTGIKKLKVGYNKVFGYYIEIPRQSSKSVPEEYNRKQTLSNCERFTTEELKELEVTLLTAKVRSAELEYEIFTEIRNKIASQVGRIQAAAAMVGQLDVLCSLAEVAVKNGYSMPEVDMSGSLDVSDGRHPVVEKSMKDGLFVPNDAFMDGDKNRVMIITGPNMAGKSTYMRQTALISLMAQIGSFVPAKAARVGIVDRIFTRIGAADNLAAGQSTFMVEMSEVADILKNATSKSLVILDEIGRGTSTFDGMSIAEAVLEYCADKRRLGAKTMFATHYHELTRLEERIEGVKNFSTSVKKRGEEIVFLRKIVPGGADRSYGVEVARLAGVPEPVIKRAKDILSEIEKNGPSVPYVKEMRNAGGAQVTIMDISGGEVAEKLRNTDLNTLTPIEAMNLLYELKGKI